MMVEIKRTLLYEEVVAQLYQMIDKEEVKLGDPFPSERDLVKRWNISRNVLREAFHVLEDRGLVFSKQGKGRFLRALPAERELSADESVSRNLERYSLLEIYETRQCLEAKAVELIAKSASAEDLVDLERCYQEMCRRFQESNSTSGEFQMHRLYAVKSKNRFLCQMITTAFTTTYEFMSSSFRDVLTQHTISDSLLDHGEILRALKARDGDKAKAIMSAHMQDTIDMLQRFLPQAE